MPKAKRPRKKYRPKPQVLPLGMRDSWKLEGGVLTALTAVNHGCATPQHFGELESHALLVERIATHANEQFALTHAKSVLLACASVENRFLTSGDIQVSEYEKVTLRSSVPLTIEWLRSRTNLEISEASRQLLIEYAPKCQSSPPPTLVLPC
jgi:hypothetical protein